MKLLPLDTKKKIHRRMSWFREGSAFIMIFGTFFAGFLGLFTWERVGTHGPEREKEKITLQEKVDHLLETNNTLRSFNAVTTVLASGKDFALDVAKAKVKQDSLKKAFQAEEQAVGIALAHAETLSPHERTMMYTQLKPIAELPPYLARPNEDEDYFVREHVRKKLESQPGFTPTIDSAKEITSAKGYGGWILLAGLLGSPLMGIASVFGFYAGRKRLWNSIVNEEENLLRQEGEAQRAAEERRAAEAAEAERVAKQPPSVSLDRDINVKQIKIKLTGKGGA